MYIKCATNGCKNFVYKEALCLTHHNLAVKVGDFPRVRALTNHDRLLLIRANKSKYKKSKKGKLSEARYKAGTGKHTKNLHVRRRRKRLKLATPPWADVSALRRFYKNTPKGQEVDHIIPLVAVNAEGEHIASGLHVIWNLRYVKPKINVKKGNRI